jgi:hypothetical protein
MTRFKAARMVRPMLHKRRGALARAIRVAGLPLVALQEHLATSDPGLVRLTLAARGTLSVFLTAVAALLGARLLGAPLQEFAAGVTLSMMGPFLMRELTQRQRQRTLLTLMLSAGAATVGTALLHGHGPAGDSCFLVLVFLCFLLHPRSPRMVGVGLVAVVTSYVGLYLGLPPATLPVQLLSLVLATPVIAFACFVAVPLNPAATLRRTVAAAQGRAAQVLRSAGRITGEAPAPGGAIKRLRRDLVRLNEAALAADDQLALLHPDGRDAVRSGLIALELAAARLIEALRAGTPGPRHAMRLRLHGQRMRQGGRHASAAGLLERGTLRATLVELGHAGHALGAAAQEIAPAWEAPPAAGSPPGPLAWRTAMRVTLAAALAMAGGMALSPQRWFWAVLTVYVVFLNARSRGDTIHKGLQRLFGTLLGIASGLVLATLLASSQVLQAAALLLSVFGMFYLFLASYTAGIFCVTVMLGLLYGMLGAAPEALLMLRLEETAIGAAAAILVAAFVLPVRTRDQVLRSGHAVLVSMLDVVRSSRQALSGVPGALPMQAMRQVDRQVADLRLALAPLTAGRLLFRRSTLERPVPALLDCVHWARVLAAASQGGAAPPHAAGLVGQAKQIEARLTELAGLATIHAGTGRPETSRPEAQPPGVDPASAEAALARLAAAVETLAGRMEVGRQAGFALDV